ncbi:MAG: hypothetical protein WC220_00065 [Pedobacter sp.]|jgi:hypothetical protein
MDIKQQLQLLQEDDLRIKIIIPLMKAFGATCIRDWHGTNERGKDVLYKKENDFGELVHKGILLKAKTISKEVFSSEVRIQIEEAVGVPITDPEYLTDKIKLKGLIIMTSFDITSGAISIVEEFAGKTTPVVEIVDGDRLCGLINKLIDSFNRNESNKTTPNFYEFNCETFLDFCDRYHAMSNTKKVEVVSPGEQSIISVENEEVSV